MKALLLTLLFSSLVFASSLSKTPIQNSLVVYNGGVGLVHEVRELTLTKNDTFIIYSDVANTIQTDSVNFSLPKGVELFSQQYKYDKLTLAKLLDANIGKRVSAHSKKVTLLSYGAKFSLVRKSNGDIVQVKNEDIVFKSIPKTLLTKPSLVWNIKTNKNINSEVELDYLINNIRWKSDYILNITKDSAKLTGWITIDNRCGKSYSDTELFVLAGDVNHASRPRERTMYAKVAMAEVVTPITPNAHGGYHLYTIPFKVNLANNEKTQIKFLDIKNLEYSKTYIATMSNPNHQRSFSSHSVVQFIDIDKVEVALPKGIIRTYSKFKTTNILLGQSYIKHTPKNTKIHIKLGNNFDVKVSATLVQNSDTKYQLIADVRYEVKNDSDEIKTILVHVPFNKRSRSKIKTSQKYRFVNGNIIAFKIKVNANSKESFKARFISKR